MSFSSQFLDELRDRVSLASVVGRRVRLTKRGREYVGLCPFHKEKSPSFNVVEDKGFFHCFGCGAHGDAIGFVMQSAGLGFPEAVEQLATEAGLEVPRESPQQRERAEREAGLQGAMEAAAVFYAEALRKPGGHEARAYLGQRGLDEATIDRFRIGFAPDGRTALKAALAGRFPEEMLVEGGLLRRPEGGGESYDYFRGRIMFPIGDRKGRVIAFGGRIIGQGQPKYLNSPETPLFQKGRVLYGWANARAAAAKSPSAIVTEGYMDVIALQRAGFETAVAPLGTALTEDQLQELWKLSAEPVLCFDGDAAGQRAMQRAADRALPILRPGFSLRFATLPAGEDPDTLILRQGRAAMAAILEGARPLADLLWTNELAARPIDTPERRADFESRLEARTKVITDNSVREHYRSYFKDRRAEVFGRRAAPARLGRSADGRGGSWKPARPGSGGRGSFRPAFELSSEPPSRPDPRAQADRRRQEILMVMVINHPVLLDRVAEDFAGLAFSAPDLDRLRQEVLKTHASCQDLDASTMKLHLSQAGFERAVTELLSSRVYDHASFARPDASIAVVMGAWDDLRVWFTQRPELRAQIVQEERDLAETMSVEAWDRMKALHEQREDDEGSTNRAAD